MTIRACPECDEEISDKAEACPHCGFPIRNEHSDRGEKTDGLSKRTVAGGILLVGALVVGFNIWGEANGNGSAQLPTTSPEWVIGNVTSNADCTTLGDHCYTVRCVVRNVGDGAGVADIKLRLNNKDTNVPIQESTTIRLGPGEREVITRDFNRAKMGVDYEVKCEVEPRGE